MVRDRSIETINKLFGTTDKEWWSDHGTLKKTAAVLSFTILYHTLKRFKHKWEQKVWQSNFETILQTIFALFRYIIQFNLKYVIKNIYASLIYLVIEGNENHTGTGFSKKNLKLKKFPDTCDDMEGKII